MTRTTDVPNPNSPHALAVSDGAQTVGIIVECDGSFFSFDTDNILLGKFQTQREAVRAIPRSKEFPLSGDRAGRVRQNRE